MVRPCGTFHLDLLALLAVDDPSAIVHGFIVRINFVYIAESRAHFLLDNGRHHILYLVSQWIQKFMLTFLLLF